MRRLIMAMLAAGTIIASSSESFGFAGGSRHRHSEGGGTPTQPITIYPVQESSVERVRSVPEPGTLVLLMSVGAGFLLWSRRRK